MYAREVNVAMREKRVANREKRVANVAKREIRVAIREAAVEKKEKNVATGEAVEMEKTWRLEKEASLEKGEPVKNKSMNHQPGERLVLNSLFPLAFFFLMMSGQDFCRSKKFIMRGM